MFQIQFARIKTITTAVGNGCHFFFMMRFATSVFLIQSANIRDNKISMHTQNKIDKGLV